MDAAGGALNPVRRSVGGLTPEVAKTAWIAPTATLVGNVHIGAGASLWYGVVARSESDPLVVGERSNLQDNTVVHVDPGRPATIGADVTVGHAAIIHGCTIEDGCLVGMGAVVLNGARIGARSLVAAGAVVTEGMHVPPGSLVVGAPAKVRRALTDAEIDRLRDNAQTYVRLAAVHADAVDL